MHMNGKLLVLALSAVFLPYAVVTTPTMTEGMVQFWLFPFWIYFHDFWMWHGLGMIIPTYIPTLPSVLFYLGLVWFVVALIVSLSMFRVWHDQVKIQSLQKISILVLVTQIILTISLVFVYWDSIMTPLIIPLPLHTSFASILLFHRQNHFNSTS